MTRIIFIIIGLFATTAFGANALEIPSWAGMRFHNESASLKLSETDAAAVEDRLASLEKDYQGAQMAVLIIDRLEGGALEDFSLKVAEAWQLGQKRGNGRDGDNGLLLVIVVQDKQYRFEVGYGLESVLPDSLIGSLGREALVPSFKQGRYVDGLYLAIDAVKKILNRGRQLSAKAFPVPPLGDKRFHNYSAALELQDYEAAQLELDLERFEWDRDDIANMRMAILVVDSLENEPIDSLSARVAEKWNLGQKKDSASGGDNGLLLVLAMKDRKYRFEIGQKLEGLITERTAEALARHIMIQEFWAGDYERGLRYTIESVETLAQGQYPLGVVYAEKDDDRGVWERFTDVLWYQTFSRPTSYDFAHPAESKSDPDWGQTNYKKAVHHRWILVLMFVVAGGCCLYSYVLGGAIGMVEGVVYSGFLMGYALPTVLLYAFIGLIVGLIAKYIAAGALAAGLLVGVGGKFGGGGASGGW